MRIQGLMTYATIVALCFILSDSQNPLMSHIAAINVGQGSATQNQAQSLSLSNQESGSGTRMSEKEREQSNQTQTQQGAFDYQQTSLDSITKSEMALEAIKPISNFTNAQEQPHQQPSNKASAKPPVVNVGLNQADSIAPKKQNIQTDAQIETGNGIAIQLEQKTELEVDPNHRNKVIMMEGVSNPLDETEARIKASMDTEDKTDLTEGLPTNLFQSTHKNFDVIYNALQQNYGEVKDSHIDEDRKRFGNDLKAMGGEMHKESTEAVRKQETRMGNLQNVQLDTAYQSMLNANKSVAKNQSMSDQLEDISERIELEKLEDQVGSKKKAIAYAGQLTKQSNSTMTVNKQIPKKSIRKQSPLNNSFMQNSRKIKQNAKVKSTKKQKTLNLKTKKPLTESKSFFQKNNNKKPQQKVLKPLKPKQNNNSLSQPINISDTQEYVSFETADLLQEAKSALDQSPLTSNKVNQQQQSAQIDQNQKQLFNKEKQVKVNNTMNQTNIESFPQKTKAQTSEMDEQNNRKNGISTLKSDYDKKKSPLCPQVQDQQPCPASQLDQLMKKGNEFKVQVGDDGVSLVEKSQEPNTISFLILPKDQRNGVAKEIQVLNSERIIGYSTYSGMIHNEKFGQNDQDHSLLLTNDDSDYYNVTVNLIVKKGGSNLGGEISNMASNNQPSLINQQQIDQKSQATTVPQVPKEAVPQKTSIGFNTVAMKEEALPPRDLSRVELATESSSSFEAAASLDVSSQESKKEIAESEHYTSRIAKQQASAMSQSKQIQDINGASNDLIQWSEVSPPTEVNTQVEDQVPDPVDEGSQLEQQSVIQLQNDLAMKPKSQIDDQQLIQLKSKSKADRIQKLPVQRKSLSADSFDQDDGSSHVDNDVDFDLAKSQVQAANQNDENQKLFLTQERQGSQEQTENELNVSDKARQEQLDREQLQESKHQRWMRKLAARGMAQTPDTSDQSSNNLEHHHENNDQQQSLYGSEQQQVEQTNQNEQAYSQQQMYLNPQRLSKESQEPQQEERVLQEQQGTERTSYQTGFEVEVSAFTDDETEHHSQLSQSRSENEADLSLSKSQDQVQDEKDQNTDILDDKEGYHSQQLKKIDPFDQAMKEKTEKWSEDAEKAEEKADEGSVSKADQQIKEIETKHGRSTLTEDKELSIMHPSQDQSAYEIPEEDKAIDKQEEKLEELEAQQQKEKEERERKENELREQIAAKLEAKKKADEQRQQKIEQMRQEAQAEQEKERLEQMRKAQALEKQKMIEELKAKRVADVEKSENLINDDETLAKEQKVLESHIEREVKLLDKIIAKRRKQGIKHLHQFKIVSQDLDNLKQQDELQAKQKEIEDQKIKDVLQKESEAKEQKRKIEEKVKIEKAKLAEKEEKMKQEAIQDQQNRAEKEIKEKKKNQEKKAKKIKTKRKRNKKIKTAKQKQILHNEKIQKAHELKNIESQSKMNEERDLMNSFRVDKLNDQEDSSQTIDPAMQRQMDLMKKKTAILSDQFEAQEKQKRQARENQIRMLEATKAKLMADDTESSDQTDKKNEKKKKKDKWPKMEIHDSSETKPAKSATETVKALLNLHQKTQKSEFNEEQTIDQKSYKTSARNETIKELSLQEEPIVKKQMNNLNQEISMKNESKEIQNEQTSKDQIKIPGIDKLSKAQNYTIQKEQVPKKQLNDEKSTNTLTSNNSNNEKNKLEVIQTKRMNEEENSMQETQDELKQIQKELDDAQKQADSYQKEKELEEQQQSKLQDKIQQNKQALKRSEEIVSAARQSLIQNDKLEDTNNQKEKEAVDTVKQAEEQGEKNGAQAAAQIIQQAKTQSDEENAIQFQQLKKKLRNTSQQVQDIVSNFQRVHSDLQDLKEEFIQQKLQELDSQIDSGSQAEDQAQSAIQLSEQIHLNQGLRSESLSNIKQAIELKKKELRELMENFDQLKGQLTQISKEKDRIEKNQELLQLEQLRVTLDETIEESERLGQDDLIQIDSQFKQTEQFQSMNPEDNQLVGTSIDDEQNIQLGFNDDSLEDIDNGPFPKENQIEAIDLLQLSEELIKAEQTNRIIQSRLNKLLI